MVKKISSILIGVIFIITTLYLAGRLVMPKYMGEVVEGAMIEEYYQQEEKEHNVLFLGDCEVYENIVPAILWEEYGIHSYIRGSAQQLMWQSYYLLEDTLRYETPDVVVLSVLAMKYHMPQSETYNRMTIDGMEWSSAKVGIIESSMTEGEQFLDYVIPLLRFHGRWNELTTDDVAYFFEKDTVTHNGYYMRVDTKPVDYIPDGNVLADYQFGDNAYEYLDQIVQLCKEEGIELILMKAPSIYPYWYPEWEEQIKVYAQEQELTYWNYLEKADAIGIDYSTDTYDGGLHLNLWGAAKLTRDIGQQLQETHGIPNRQEEKELASIWEEKLQMFYEEIEIQKEKYGVEHETIW